MDFSAYSNEHQRRINQTLEYYLPAASNPLNKAMRYAVLNGGKRLRPLLVYITGETLGAKLVQLDAPACSVELIHTYSLIHDDLPAMDNDDLRRGKPTCHKAFDDATAILAGDALHSLALEILAKPKNNTPNPEIRNQMLTLLTQASGAQGMAGGQVLDLEAEGKLLSQQEIETMYQLKTGALIQVSIQLGALLAGYQQMPINLIKFAKVIGLAFQIHDDILDIEGETATTGKLQGSDANKQKPTFPLMFGIDKAKKQVAQLREEALQQLADFKQNTSLLAKLADYMVTRSH